MQRLPCTHGGEQSVLYHAPSRSRNSRRQNSEKTDEQRRSAFVDRAEGLLGKENEDWVGTQSSQDKGSDSGEGSATGS